MTTSLIPATDADTIGFFQAAARGELAAYVCLTCENVSFPRRYLCPNCQSVEGEWRSIAPRGQVLSWTVVTHQVSLAFDVPYAVVVVQHSQHPDLHFIGRISGEPDLDFGSEVRAVFESVDGENSLVNWEILSQ